jgi:S-adenosylmethionine hydrolase
MNRPVITLLTDFGTTDHYVAAMKGVILGICPDAHLIDITHHIPPYKILEAAFTLSQAWPYFPPGSIHLVVVDPGVGSSRRPLLAEAGGHLFVAPDNGVLTLVRKATGGLKSREVTAERFFRHPISRTFHGRDIFAPSAAHLATGVPPAEFGTEIYDPVILPAADPVETSPRVWTGTILDGHFEVMLGEYRICQFYKDYSSCRAGELFLIHGSSGYLEISARQANAASQVGIYISHELTLRLTVPQ